MSMRRFALPLAILGIFLLLLMLLFQKPLEINSPEELKNLKNNQIIYTEGKVIKETKASFNNYLTLDNSLVLSCKSCLSYKNKSITTLARVSFYKNKTYLNVIKLEEND